MLPLMFSGKVIDPNNRSFRAEAKLPQDAAIRPNQIAQVRILDYSAPNAGRYSCKHSEH